MNYKIIIEYEGTRYNGWQRQKNAADTIQNIIENAVYEITGERAEVNGSGRTDAGVHALGQTANFKLTRECADIMDKLNNILPADIRIIHCQAVDDRFHARLSAKGKTYIYKIDTGKKPNVFTRRTVQHFPYDIDMESIKKAAGYMVGEKDFKAFCSNKRIKKSTVRNVYSIDIEQEGTEITFTFKGNGFLYNMVRIMTGTLLDAGTGKFPPEYVKQIILSRDRSKAGITMPPRGLALVSVDY